ncbi:Outer membrane protein assembly factor BamB precursor [Vibrio ruber DSM 16370]|uniref:Outer membrane protein assembly factor BamB n=1 Tax=Vibrio ruber (strain DSM 16370 / JCM 11486 / BCRC 17186 / CECT 7878 / LMG 23124 / VR1) TaxID=1123498 RepID=A0A1R4LN87_VIBR1|nr:outer membrane protein assembly factor BamB [Vibrio ruber]SJN57985.1 Outer membrane protein assembly factor BamB precursor [Vibrio ruber DSM 16370]
MKKWFGNLFLMAVITGGLAGCSGEEESVVMAPVPVVNSEFTPHIDWRASVGSGVGHYFSKLKPKYVYDTIFVADRDGLVKALNPENGKELWHRDLEIDDPIRLAGGIAAGFNQIYVGSENGIVYALNAKTGDLKWKQNIGGEVLASPTTDSNLLIINTSNGNLTALDQNSGKEQWVISTEVPNLTLRGVSEPVAVSGGVFWGTAGGRLAAAITSRGQMIWQQPIGIPKGSTEIDRLVDVDSSPLVIGDSLYTIGYNGQLVDIDLRSGKPVWKRTYSSAKDIATDGGRLFIATDEDHIVAVDARSGTELWTNRKLEHRLVTAPVVISNYVVVGDSEGYLYWIDRNSGEFVAQQFVNSSGFAVSPIALPDNSYLLTTRNGDLKKLTIN